MMQFSAGPVPTFLTVTFIHSLANSRFTPAPNAWKVMKGCHASSRSRRCSSASRPVAVASSRAAFEVVFASLAACLVKTASVRVAIATRSVTPATANDAQSEIETETLPSKRTPLCQRDVSVTLRDHPLRPSPALTRTLRAPLLTCLNSEDFTRPNDLQLIEVLVGAIPWGFKSPLRHQAKALVKV